MKKLSCLLAFFGAFMLAGCAFGEKPQKPFCESMHGKVFCGYQGWYRTPYDKSGLGWEHWETPAEEFEPGKCGIDAWPDVSEFDEDEKVATKFRKADGSVAFVYTNENPKTVNRHFKWMKEYGIDGVFLQRFALDVTGGHHQSNLLLPSNNRVLKNVRDAAEANERSFAVMYDLTLMGKDNDKNSLEKVKKDWKNLVDAYGFFKSPAYLRHNGKPVIAIYGIGFGDKRDYSLDEQIDLINFFKNDKQYGGCAIMLGVPTYWRTLNNDATSDPRLLELIKSADVLLPWSVGRFGTIEGAKNHAKNQFAPDAEWCRQNNVLYMPLAFPGFSWANRYPGRKFDQIPRLGGKFFWQQIYEARKAGAQTLYVAMFDEMDEGTQIFKTDQNPPVGASPFLTYKPDDSDLYLRLCGAAGRLMRGEIPLSEQLPFPTKSQQK
ncbi:MAG: hypothetical protein J6P03_07515 [Opitutales bacterium]|nr:hypothetical protein [Opitutales bacterium]